MPPWVASVPRSTLLCTRRAIDRLQPALRCPSTLIPRLPIRRVRRASTVVSPTTINLRPNILPENKELYNALSTLKEAAKDHVNASRLQLALQGLTAHDAVTRVAVLGLNSQVGAQRLARLLLADPLGAEEPWEKELDRQDDTQEQALLLKYGDDSGAEPPTQLYRVLSVPSRILKSHNMEILVSSLNVPLKTVASGSTSNSNESLLLPEVQDISTANSSVPFPVHKTLVLGVGVDGAIAFGRFASGNSEEVGNMVKVAVDLSVPLKEQGQRADDGNAAIDMDIGTEALAIFRKSIENSITYERGWFQSGLPVLSTWLIKDLEPSEPMKPVVKALISSIASDVESKITKADAAHLRNLISIPTEQDVTASILSQLDSWAEKSHAELRDQLDEAFSARNWLGLSWWQLFWRVDDITMISSEILERKWLVSAERNSFYLAGSMNRAGFPDDVQKLAFNAVSEETTQYKSLAAENTQTDLSTYVRIPRPWPDHIPTARTELIADTIPPLQALAQRLILQTLSTTSISSAVSALLYASMSTFSIFEASTVAALGLTFSLRKMQKLWEGARKSWQTIVREQGRRTLKDTEETIHLIIENYKQEKVRDEGAMQKETAREAVKRVRQALEKVDGHV